MGFRPAGSHLIWIFFLMAASAWGQAATQDKSCLACHNTARLNELQKKAGPDVIPEDPTERRAFSQLMSERDPRRRKTLAEQFLASYPRSWVLEPVYEIASKTSMSLGDLTAALDYGARSLRILPENPFLLLAMADAQTAKGLPDQASGSAHDALGYLDRFARPSSMEAGEWPQTRARLESQAWFDIGRAAAMKSLPAEAESALVHALQLEPGAAGPAFLLGMVHLGNGQPGKAAGFLALAARDKGPLGTQAAERLKAIQEAGVVSLAADIPALSQATLRYAGSREYAGSDTCRECHSAQHAAWKATGMGRMFRPYAAKDVIGDFTSGQTVTDDAGKPVARAVVRAGKHYLEIRDGSVWKPYPVDYLIGSKWQQGYATRLAGGEIQVFPLQYNRLEKRWVNYWKIIDPAESARTDITRFHEVVPGATYQLECAPCHTSQEHFEGGKLQARAASFREGGINCEMCHGPSAQHAAQAREGHFTRSSPSAPPVDFKRISSVEYVAICSQCHMQSGQRNPEPEGPMNYSASGDKFYRILSSRPYVDYSRKAFYKDGRFRETVFIVESFVRSACFRKGGATCGNCHNPHPADAATNATSVKFGADSNRMCLGCHVRFEADPAAHTHHAAGSEGSQCVSCHMPKIMNALLFKARSHQIDDIPNAEMTARFGADDSPNACLLCHKDKDMAWLTAKLRNWKTAAR